MEKTFQFPAYLDVKIQALTDALMPHDRIGIAFSGGVDSSFLLWFAHCRLKKPVTAVFVESTFVGRSERENADRVASEIGVVLEKIVVDPTVIPVLRDNPVTRCYHCKKEVMGRVRERAFELGCCVLADGSHAGDSVGYRPGKQALLELGILSPLAVAGLVKDEIRELSRLAGLSVWNKPSQSCLATRFPYGTALTRDLLCRVDRCEEILRELGFGQLRVRVHGDLARIEITPQVFTAFAREEIRTRILREFKELGFHFVTIDLAGFRSGSWDETIRKTGTE